jgi:hypothetical protein
MAERQHDERQRHIQILLHVAFRHTVRADDAEQAFACVQALSGESLEPVLFHDAIAACLGAGQIREPIRLPPGSLQCHWCLELTPRAAASVGAHPAAPQSGC